MKLRLMKSKSELVLCCPNGSLRKADSSVISKVLTGFNKPTSFKGNDGFWNQKYADMDDVPGKTLAYVDDALCLVVLDTDVFKNIIVRYLSAKEYAEKNHKSVASVKNMCTANRIEGAFKIGNAWLIPENAPYPARSYTSK